jgi:hypothetical protein
MLALCMVGAALLYIYIFCTYIFDLLLALDSYEVEWVDVAFPSHFKVRAGAGSIMPTECSTWDWDVEELCPHHATTEPAGRRTPTPSSTRSATEHRPDVARRQASPPPKEGHTLGFPTAWCGPSVLVAAASAVINTLCTCECGFVPKSFLSGAGSEWSGPRAVLLRLLSAQAKARPVQVMAE